MVTSGGQAVFAVVAKDAATKTLNGIGKAFGGLKRGGVSALRGLAKASAIAAGALAGFVIAGVKAAAEEEKSVIRLRAALKARGFDVDEFSKKIEAQAKAFDKFAISGEEVRKSVEIGTRFFKNQNRVLKANEVAANISLVTDKSLSSVMTLLGKATSGSTKALRNLGIEVEKGASKADILRIANEKYKEAADEIAKSTAVRFEAAMNKLNEAFKDFGIRFLPLVNEGLKIFAEDILPQVEQFLTDLGPVVDDLINNYIGPLVTSFDELAKTMGFEDGFGFLIGAIDLALVPFKITLGLIKGLLDGINEAFKLFNSLASSKTGALLAGNARTQYLSGGNLGAAAPMGDTSGYLQTNIQFSIGTQKQDELVSNSLQRMAPGRRGGY